MLRDIENDLVEEVFKIHNIYVPKIVNKCYTNNIEKKLKLFLCDTYDDLKKVAGNDEELNAIVSELERLNKEKYFGALYDAAEEQKLLEESARASGKEEGILEGSLTKSKEIAKSLLAKKVDINIISECTGLSIDIIKSL
ncbi:MAG: hypothetical protein IJF92_05250 [Bacilli bacterium]|nr:hypothetical protein [Bacilli bacterium]